MRVPDFKLKSLLLKEYLLLLRKKKFLLMVLSLPIIFGVLYQLSTTMEPGISIRIGVCNLDSSEQSARLVTEMREYFSVTEYSDNCEEQLARGVREESIFLGLLVPENFFQELSALNKSDIYIYYDNSNPVLSNYLDFFFQLSLRNYENALLRQAGDSIKREISRAELLISTIYPILDSLRSLGYGIPELADQAQEIQQAIQRVQDIDVSFVTEPVVTNKVGAYDLRNAPGISSAMTFAILSLFTALLLVSSNILFDKENNFLVRLNMSKTSNITYILSKLLFFDFVLIIQYLVIFPLFFSLTWLNVNIVSLLFSIFVVASINVLMGVLVGLLSENQAIAVLTALLLTLPFLFLSGMFYPRELFPPPLKLISDIFPLSNQIVLLKQSMAFGYDLSLNHYSVQLNLAYLFVFLFASWAILHFRKH